MKFKKLAFILTFFLITFAAIRALAQETPRPIFASSVYNGTIAGGFGYIYVPTTTPLGNRACYFDNNSTMASSVTTATELSYLSGATSNIQAQINSVTSGAVLSVFGRNGNVTAQSGDYASFYLQPSNNLSDLVSASTARTNLGLGSAATQSASAFDAAGSASAAQAAAEAASDSLGSAASAQAAAEAASDPSGSAASAQAAAQASSLQKSANLSDLSNVITARSNLGLGSAATQASSAFDASGSAASVLSSSLQKSNNLSDLVSASAARTNLGLGSAATQPTSAFDAAGAAASAQAAAEAASDPSGSAAAAQAASLQKTANLSDVSSASTARSNLGLGSAATQMSSFFLQVANNLSDLASAATARTNLGLGSAASQASTYFLQAANNLSDLLSPSTARTNLGLGSAATHASTDFQPAGSYLTGLSGDGSASGPGVGNLTLINSINRVYVDFASGNDSTGTGSPQRPWKTIQHTCNSISPTINVPVTIYVSGGNNDSDSGTVTCPPNISMVSDYSIQTNGDFVISGGVTNDIAEFINIIFTGNFTWVRNDATEINLTFNNSSSFGSIDFEQQGSGVGATFFLATGGNVALGAVTLRAAQVNFTGISTAYGTINFKDSNSAYLLVTGGDLYGADFQLHGGITAEFSGAIADTGYAISGTTTGSGTPTLVSDDGSLPVPANITGAYNLILTSNAQHELYSPATPGNWSPAPSNVASALDQLAARPSGGGGSARTTNTVSTHITVPTLTGDYILNVNTSSGALAETLPDAVASAGWCIDMKNIGSPVHTVTTNTQSSQTIDGQSTYSITGQNDSYHYCAVGGEWFVY